MIRSFLIQYPLHPSYLLFKLQIQYYRIFPFSGMRPSPIFALICIFAILFIITNVQSRAIVSNGPNGNANGNGDEIGEMLRAEMNEWKMAIDHILDELNSTNLADLDAKNIGGFESKLRAEFNWNAPQGGKSAEQNKFAAISPTNSEEMKKRPIQGKEGKNRDKRQMGAELKNKCERKAMKKLAEHKKLQEECIARCEHAFEFTENAIEEARRNKMLWALCYAAKLALPFCVLSGEHFWYSMKIKAMKKLRDKALKVCASALVALKEAEKTGQFRDEIKLADAKADDDWKWISQKGNALSDASFYEQRRLP